MMMNKKKQKKKNWTLSTEIEYYQEIWIIWKTKTKIKAFQNIAAIFKIIFFI